MPRCAHGQAGVRAPAFGCVLRLTVAQCIEVEFTSKLAVIAESLCMCVRASRLFHCTRAGAIIPTHPSNSLLPLRFTRASYSRPSSGCGICVKKCPFDAIRIINLPKVLHFNNC